MFFQVLFFLLFASPLLSYNCDYTPSDVGQQADVVALDSAEQTISRQICSTVTLKCMSPQSNRLFMFWSVNDVIMFSNDKPVIPLDEFKYGAKIITDGNSNILGGELTIRSINETDDATYSCQVPAGTKFKLHLNVLVPPGTLALTLTIKSGTADILREGNQITLTCFSEGGNPRPNLLWRRGDVLLDASLYKWEGSGGKFGRTSSTLQWTLRWDDHQTEFRCFDDKATISASKTLSVLFAPRINMGPFSELSVLEHSSISVNCTVTANPEVTADDVRWNKDDDATQIGTGFRYEIRNVTTWDAGRYTCTADNTIRKSSSIKLLVLTYPKCELSLNDTTTYDPSNPVALSKPTRQENGDVMIEMTENQWTQVRCSCDGEVAGSSSPRWTKDGVVAADGNELNLKNVQRSSAGTYKCTCSRTLSPTYAASFQASDTKKLVLSVLYKPGQGRIDIPKYIISEERTTFSCFTEQPGNPPCDYIWYKEEQEIFRGKDYELNPVMLSHAGRYSCLPVNKVGPGSRDSKQVVVIEYPKPLMGSDDQDLVESSLMPASAVQLKCQFTGSPPPTITWYKDGIPISSLADNDKRFEVSQKNEIQSESHRYIATSLLKFYGPKRTSLKALEREEAGSYSCVASFDFVKYEVQSRVSLSIKFPPEITNDKKQSVEMHKTGRIYFKIKSYPKPLAIKWFNSSKEMIQNSFANNGGNHQQIDEKWKITTTDFLGEKDAYLTVLEIKTVDEFDLREYSVQVDNAVSIGTSSVQVIAATKPNAPSQLKNVSLDWKSVGLEWLGGSDGGINQQFVIEARSPKDNSVKAKKSVANTTSIVFDGLLPNVTYKFIMYAENRIGRSEYSNEIFVTLPAIKVYSPSRVDFSADARCITIVLPSSLYSTTVSPTTSSSGPDGHISNSWGNFCASVDVFDGTSWITEYPCIKERKIDLSGSKIKKITQVRVSICSDERHDICSEQKYNSDNAGIPNNLTIIVGCVCGFVVVVLLAILLTLYVRSRKKNGVKVKELKTITQTVHLNENGTLPGKPSNGYISYTLSSNRNNSSKNIFKVDNENDQQHDWNGSVCMASVHNCNNHNCNNHNCNNHDHNCNNHDHYGNNNNNNNNLDNYSFDNGDFLVGSTFVDTCEASIAPPPTFQSPSIIWHPQQQHPHNHQALPYSAQSPYISEDEHTSTMELIHKPSFPINYMTDGSSSTQGTIKSFNLVNRSSTDVNKQAKIIHEVIV